MTPLLFTLALGCTPDQNFAERSIEMIAVAYGDFDAVELNLNRLEVPHQLYEGFISGPAYDEGPEDLDLISLEVEYLFTGETESEGRVLFLNDVVFVNSGTRGFGEYVYNGLDRDDGIVTDGVAIDNVREYVEDGGVLVVSDWAYELVEAAWPGQIEFFGDDTALDEAQAGSVGRYTARAGSDAVRDAVGDEVSVSYDFSYWTVIEAVASDVDVHLSADVLFRVSDSEGEGTLPDAPLLVSFEVGNGLVIYSTFHWNAQSAALADPLLTALVEGLPVAGAAEDTTEDTGE